MECARHWLEGRLERGQPYRGGREGIYRGSIPQKEEELALDDHFRGRGQLCCESERAMRAACPKVKEKNAAPGWWPEGGHGDLVMGHGASCDSGGKGRWYVSQYLLERKP